MIHSLIYKIASGSPLSSGVERHRALGDTVVYVAHKQKVLLDVLKGDRVEVPLAEEDVGRVGHVHGEVVHPDAVLVCRVECRLGLEAAHRAEQVLSCGCSRVRREKKNCIDSKNKIK